MGGRGVIGSRVGSRPSTAGHRSPASRTIVDETFIDALVTTTCTHVVDRPRAHTSACRSDDVRRSRRRPPTGWPAAIAAGELSPVEAVAAALGTRRRGAAGAQLLHGDLGRRGDAARRRAAAAAVARGDALGVLHGVPVAVKDTTPVAGRRTTLGSYAFEHWVPGPRRLRRDRAAPGRRDHHRPDDVAGVRPHAHHRQPAVGHDAQPARTSTARRAARRAAAARPWRPGACRSPRAPTWAARCASRRRGAASSGSSRASGGSRWTCCPACSTRSPTTGRSPAAPTTPACSSPRRRAPTTPTSCRSPARSTCRRPLDGDVTGHAARAVDDARVLGGRPGDRRGRRGRRRAASRPPARSSTSVDPGFGRARRSGVDDPVGRVHGRLLRRRARGVPRPHGPRRRRPDRDGPAGVGRPTTSASSSSAPTCGGGCARPRRPRRAAVPDDGRSRPGRPPRPTVRPRRPSSDGRPRRRPT